MAINIDLSQADRAVGSMLSGDQVERLREAINWGRTHRGLRWKGIAFESDVPEHTVRNFANRKSNRPDNAVLGKLYKYVVSNRGLLRETYSTTGKGLLVESPEGDVTRLPDDLIKQRLLPISEGDLKRVFNRYTGYYLCFRRSYRPSRMSVSWLHIMPLNPNVVVSKGGMPLPRFTLSIGYPDRFDPLKTQSYIIIGYALSRNGRLFLAGHHDGEPQSLVLNEPSIAKFTYLQGLCLLTSAHDKQPFSTRVVCQFLGSQVHRGEWQDRIGVFSQAEFESLFDNADVVRRVIGDTDLLIGSDPP